MKIYSCLMFSGLQGDKEVTGAYKEVEAMSLQDAAVSYCDSYIAAPGTYYLPVSDGNGHSEIFELSVSENYQKRITKGIKPLKNVNKEIFDVLISRTLSRRQ